MIDFVEYFEDLNGEFVCGGDDESVEVVVFSLLCLDEFFEDGDKEGEGFVVVGFGGVEDIMVFESEGNGGFLDVC